VQVLSVINLLISEGGGGVHHTLNLIRVVILSHVQCVCTVIKTIEITPMKCINCIHFVINIHACLSYEKILYHRHL
jgi:hypothetical protein